MQLETISKIINSSKLEPHDSISIESHNESLNKILESITMFYDMDQSKTSPIFLIEQEHGFIPDIDNVKLSQEILKSTIRFTEDYTHTRFEDTQIVVEDNSEAHKVLVYMKHIANTKGMDLSDWWSQVHQPLESTDIHNHFSTTVELQLSWVYYVKIPEGAGSLVFILDDRCNTKAIKPIEGKYIIFPSWLKHKVSKNLSSDTRICMAGNFIRK